MDLIIKKAQKGDKKAFIQAINDYLPQMYKVAKTRLDSDEDIGDAVQETILSAYKNIKNLKEIKYFKTWIIRILINKCNDIITKNKKVIYVENYNELSKNKDMTTYDKDIEEKLDFTETLKVLNEDYRTVIILYYVNDFTTKEISEILNEKEGTIKSKLSRARQQLKQHYMIKGLDNKSFNSNVGGNVK